MISYFYFFTASPSFFFFFLPPAELSAAAFLRDTVFPLVSPAAQRTEVCFLSFLSSLVVSRIPPPPFQCERDPVLPMANAQNLHCAVGEKACSRLHMPQIIRPAHTPRSAAGHSEDSWQTGQGWARPQHWNRSQRRERRKCGHAPWFGNGAPSVIRTSLAPPPFFLIFAHASARGSI